MNKEEILKIDKQIQDIDKVICRHLDNSTLFERGEISQDILAQLRNFVEHIMLKCYANGNDIPNIYENIQKAIEYIKSDSKYRELNRLHHFLQIVASHYTLDEENSERLMLKYYENLLRIKIFMRDKYKFNILDNLNKFPLKIDSDLQEYYSKIAQRIDLIEYTKVESGYKYYVQKIKPFFVNEKIYYEITITLANDYSSKFDRIIAFTDIEITKNYAVKLSLLSKNIEILGKQMPILVITAWEVSIRDCEFANFSKIIRGTKVTIGASEKKELLSFLTETKYNLVDLVLFSDARFNDVKNNITRNARTIIFMEDLKKSRDLIKSNKAGSNVLRYLLYTMNNKIIKMQTDSRDNNWISFLYLSNGCIPFDKLPLNNSLINHNPRIIDLLYCIDIRNRKDEILAKRIKNNSEIKGNLYTAVKDIGELNDVEGLVKLFNSKLYKKHLEENKLVIDRGQIYINGYEKDTKYIIDRLKSLSNKGIGGYYNSVKQWLENESTNVDSDEKKNILREMFINSKVALVYGSAGVGKTYLINHIAQFWDEQSKLFLAQTNPAIDNLKRRVVASNCDFSTVAKFNRSYNMQAKYDILIIDECSTISNKDMKEILDKAEFEILVLVGDTYQINSIRFGNWFELSSNFVNDSAVFKLKNPHRAKDNKNLLTLWDRVREMDDSILEIIARQDYSRRLNSSIFTAFNKDEIILCLNYDGLYGINNINRFLQEANNNKDVYWGVQKYKINDPVLFNDAERFSNIIYNNMKGTIVDINIFNKEELTEYIQFDIKIEKAINELEVRGEDFELVSVCDDGNSIIRFNVNKRKSVDEDEDSSNTVVPFQIAYAVSIHKAQGLEYNSVKIVITDEVDEMISHNIFYTAITRSKENLKIYWSPEVEKRVLSTIKPRNLNKDYNLLKVID